jgi:hypothetical protein
VITQEHCEMAGEMLCKKPIFASRAWPIWADTTKMVELLGLSRVSMREGVRRVIEAGQKARTGKHKISPDPLALLEEPLERFLDRMVDIRISEAEHGPPNARRYEYEPTYLLRGLSALHIEFTRAS